MEKIKTLAYGFGSIVTLNVVPQLNLDEILNIIVQIIIAVVTLIKLLKGKKDKS